MEVKNCISTAVIEDFLSKSKRGWSNPRGIYDFEPTHAFRLLENMESIPDGTAFSVDQVRRIIISLSDKRVR